jgi:RNA polymerase-binding transcription factor
MTPLRAIDQDLRQRLHDIHARLHQLHPRASADLVADARRNDLCDSAQAMGALEAQTMSVERLTLTARRITETLQRIADGTYGRCEECDEPIPPARLKAIPTATLCVPCQSAAELRAHRAACAPRLPGDDQEAPHL